MASLRELAERAAELRLSALRRVSRSVFRSERAAGLRRLLLRGRATDVAEGLDPDIALMLVLAGATGNGELTAATPDKARRHMLEGIRLSEEMPEEPVDVRDVEVTGATGSLPARLYEPAGDARLERGSRGLVFIHGGGWVTGDLETHDTLCRRLAIHGRMRVLAVCPRLAPEHPFPAAVLDSIAAFRDVAARAESFGIDPERLGIGGDSAGGNLSAVTGLATRGDARKPALALLIYPATDATRTRQSHTTRGDGYLLTRETMSWYMDHYLGGADVSRIDPRLSPLWEEDVRGAPPAIVVVAGFDPLVDEGVAYAERLREAGVPTELMRFDSLPHGFALMTGIVPAAMDATVALAKRAGATLG